MKYEYISFKANKCFSGNYITPLSCKQNLLIIKFNARPSSTFQFLFQKQNVGRKLAPHVTRLYINISQKTYPETGFTCA